MFGIPGISNRNVRLLRDSDAIGGQTLYGVWHVLLALGLSFFLSMMMAYVYRQTHRGLSYSVSFVHTMILMGITVTINDNATYFAFAATGLGRGDVGGVPAFQTAMICDDRGLEPGSGGRATARRLVATPIGRATVISDLALITAAGADCP